jgi:hypothetical protein
MVLVGLDRNVNPEVDSCLLLNTFVNLKEEAMYQASFERKTLATKTHQNAHLFSAFAVLAVLLCANSSFAQTAPQFTEYAAKFVCGTPTTTQVSNGQIAAGTYATTINIHNPHDVQFSSQTSTTFLKKAVLSMPEGTPLIPPSALVQDNLPNDFAEEVDCLIIRKLLGASAPPAPAFIEGFVVIIVPPTSTSALPNVLDVVGIYTNKLGAMEIQPASERFFTPGTTSIAQAK